MTSRAISKTVSESLVEQVQILLPCHINGANRLFGGRLMEWIDIVAAVVARRHAETDVTTASVDSLKFLAPALLNDTILLRGRLTYVGRTSMEVRVDTYVEALSGERKLINTAFLVLVSIDENQNPIPVPSLTLISQEEEDENASAIARKHARLQYNSV